MPPLCAIVLFGATGDLALRMLYPSLYFLEADGLLPDGVELIGTARQAFSDETFADHVEQAVRDRVGEDFSEEAWVRFRRRLRYVTGDVTDLQTYERLDAVIGGCSDRIFYLSTSPRFYGVIAESLKRAGLSGGRSRVVVEKPMGRDLASCRQINDSLGAAFSEDRIFRIDHYLGKETVQNLIALRFGNALFEPLWSKVSVDHVRITVAETVGVEGRWGYYDEYGAIRDMVQNHVMQLLCLVAMEPPASLDANSVRNEKVKVVRSLRPIGAAQVEAATVRGQYKGYTREQGGRPSDTETYAAIEAYVDNWRWAGVPFYLNTGKRLGERRSEIIIQFRSVPHSIFPGQELLPNRLVIRLQPEEEISLSLMNKTPTLGAGGGMELEPLALNLRLDKAFDARRRIAYERLLLEVIRNDPTLFVRRDEVESAWTWIDAIVEGWEKAEVRPLPYEPGSWGPPEAGFLMDGERRGWFL